MDEIPSVDERVPAMVAAQIRTIKGLVCLGTLGDPASRQQYHRLILRPQQFPQCLMRNIEMMWVLVLT